MHSIYRIEEKQLVSKNDTSSFFLYTILIQENISLHYLFIIKDIMMIRSKSHKIILGNCETQICNMKAVIHNQWR